MTDQTKAVITELDLYRLHSTWCYEVINGEWVELNVYEKALRERRIISQLVKILDPIIRSKRLGEIINNMREPTAFVLRRDENSIQIARIPDVAFSRGHHLPPYDVWVSYRLSAPTLAVLIAVQQDFLAARLSRAADFLRYGTEEVWIIYPTEHHLHRYQRGEEPPEIYNDSQSLQTLLFPGLEIKIAKLFVVNEA